ncbi:MAG: hypothetical protein ACRCU1_09515 [Alsobacter sp.]
MKQSESDIAAVVVAWLEDHGHDVYQEVEVSSGVADIVALSGPGREVWIVEAKRQWSFDLLAQCLDRKRSAQRVFAAVPESSSAGMRVANELGIGVLLTSENGVHLHRMAARVSSDLRHGSKLRNKLRPEHKTAALAGSPSAAGRHTAFRATCDQLRHVVQMYPGRTLKELLAQIQHHYSSLSAARSTLAARIRSGLVPGVELAIAADGKLCVWPAGKRGYP